VSFHPDRKTRDVFGTLLRGILNKSHSILHKADFFLAQNAPKSFVAGLRRDPLGELTALPQTPVAAFDGPTSKRGEGRGRKKKKDDGWETGGKGTGDATHPHRKFLATPLR